MARPFTQSGQTVTVRNASYNANIPTGGSVIFGFNANWSGSHPAPTGFTLNGQSCGGGGGAPGDPNQCHDAERQ